MKSAKEIWNVFENKNTLIKLPKEAMKAFRNYQSAVTEFLLGNSIRYYEKMAEIQPL